MSQNFSNPAVDRRAPSDFLARMEAALAAGHVDLPAFPQVVIQVQEAFKNENYTPQMIARVVKTEPSLADRLLNMANSTAFNATGRVIISLEVAITRLGAQKVYSVALAHAIQHVRRSESLQSIAGPLDEIWSECVTVAHFSQSVAKRCALSAPDAFVAGLLHGIGRLYILVQCVREAPSRPLGLLSRHLIDEWHPAIAKAVLKSWKISDEVCEAVGAQAEAHLARPGPPALTDVLTASIRLAERLQNRHDNASFNAGGAFARLDLSPEACQALITEASSEVKALQRALLR